MADSPTTAAPTSAGRTRPRWWPFAKVVLLLAATALAAWAISGKTDELSGASAYLDNLDWGWMAVAAIVEGLSYVAFAAMQRRLLQAGKVRAPLGPMTGVTLAGNAIQNSLPAGIVVSAAYAFRWYRRFGADDVLAGWVIVAMTVLSLMSLSALAAVGLALAASSGSALDLVEVILGQAAAMAILVAAWTRRSWFMSHSVRAVRLSQRVTRHPVGEPEDIVRAARIRVSAITPTRQDWIVAGAMGACNWIFDLACLVSAFFAVNAEIPWRGLLLAYAAAQLATNLPITPGGLGVVEGSLTIALVAFGGGEASTVAAVLVYRLFNFWALLPVGWSACGVLSIKARHTRERNVATRALTLNVTEFPAP